MVEYSRTAVIAHISQATKGWQEGWGRPGKSEILSDISYSVLGGDADIRDEMGESTLQNLYLIYNS